MTCEPPVTNAGNDPYAGCTVGAGTGLSYTRSEVEPFGAVNPTASSNVIAVFQQDRWNNGGAHGLAAGVTQNGGSSWTIVQLPFTQCATNAPRTCFAPSRPAISHSVS